MTSDTLAASARAACIRYLARRDYSRLELSQRLRAKGFPPVVIGPLLDALTDEGLVSDRRFAETLLRRRAEQGYGILRIRAELRQLGVEEAEIDGSEVDWEAVLLKAYRKRYGVTEPASVQDFSARRRFLFQRGFNTEQINRLLHLHERFDAHSDLVNS